MSRAPCLEQKNLQIVLNRSRRIKNRLKTPTCAQNSRLQAKNLKCSKAKLPKPNRISFWTDVASVLDIGTKVFAYPYLLSLFLISSLSLSRASSLLSAPAPFLVCHAASLAHLLALQPLSLSVSVRFVDQPIAVPLSVSASFFLSSLTLVSSLPFLLFSRFKSPGSVKSVAHTSSDRSLSLSRERTPFPPGRGSIPVQANEMERTSQLRCIQQC